MIRGASPGFNSNQRHRPSGPDQTLPIHDRLKHENEAQRHHSVLATSSRFLCFPGQPTKGIRVGNLRGLVIRSIADIRSRRHERCLEPGSIPRSHTPGTLHERRKNHRPTGRRTNRFLPSRRPFAQGKLPPRRTVSVGCSPFSTPPGTVSRTHQDYFALLAMPAPGRPSRDRTVADGTLDLGNLRRSVAANRSPVWPRNRATQTDGLNVSAQRPCLSLHLLCLPILMPGVAVTTSISIFAKAFTKEFAGAGHATTFRGLPRSLGDPRSVRRDQPSRKGSRPLMPALFLSASMD